MTLRPSTCPSCSALYDAEQRYCLGCGALVAPRRVDPLLALGFPPEEALGGEPAAVLAAPAAVAADRALPARQGGGLRRGSRSRWRRARWSLGGVAGAALGPTPEDSLAAAPARQVVALVVPEATTTAAAEAPAARQPATPRHSAADPGGRSERRRRRRGEPTTPRPPRPTTDRLDRLDRGRRHGHDERRRRARPPPPRSRRRSRPARRRRTSGSSRCPRGPTPPS